LARKSLVEDEGVRSARLLGAQAKAADLFAAIEPRGIIAPGVRETEASDAIRDLAAGMFGVDRHWHNRIVRAGPNTLQPYRTNPLDRAIAADDIVFLDFAPGSDKPMRRTDRNGQAGHWILEVHPVDLDRQIGGFFEELLDLGPGPA
jgi:hypothetical protein